MQPFWRQRWPWPKPYEIWRYYNISYEFVFVDDTGFGDYRLITPVWEAWQRVK